MKNNETKKIDVRVQKTYDKLFKTFYDLLSTKNYENITILELCEKTGIHRATFYKHFSDKQEFVKFCINKKLCELNLDTTDFLFETKKSNYIDMCERIVTFISDNKEFIADFNTDEPSFAFFDALETAVSDFVEKRLNYAASCGYNFVSQRHLLARFYSGALISILKSWILHWDEYSKQEILDFIVKRYDELDYSYRNNKYASNI